MRRFQNFVATVSLFLIGTATTTFEISSERDWLYNNTSVQDILSSGLGQKANEKILEQIISTVKQYASACPTYKENILIDLSTEGFKFPKNYIQVDLGSDSAMELENISISELPSIKRKLYSTTIQCESARTAKIEVKLPKDLEISAYIKMSKITNSTSESEAEPFFDSYQGSISIILKNNSISKQFFIQENYDEITRWKIFHSKSVVSLDIAPEFQIPIYNKQQAIFDEVELPLRKFLIRKFNAEFRKSGISLADVCSKFINEDENLEEVNSQSQSQHDLYLLPNTGISLYNEYFESAGPILIDGLSSFNNTQFTISGNKALSSDGEGYYFFTTPSYDDPEIKEITVKIRTNNLKGKVEYSFNSEPFPITFFLEFIEFEVKKKNIFKYESKSEKDIYNKSGTQHYYPHGSYARSNTNDVNVKVNINNLGQIKVEIPKISSIKIMDKENATAMHTYRVFINIYKSLINPLKEKLDQSLFTNCP